MSSVTYKGAVYPWQCDHIGHMNVMWYVCKFDEANWNFFATLGLAPTYFAEQHRGMAAIQQNIAYKHELNRPRFFGPAVDPQPMAARFLGSPRRMVVGDRYPYPHHDKDNADDF
jgi:hypothetical protein